MSVRILLRELLAKSPVTDGLFRRVFWSRLFFPEVEMRFLNSLKKNSIDIAIDVGAAMGSYSWILNRKSRRVIAFEPGERHSENLRRVIFGTGICVVKAAVGSSCGRCPMYTPGSDTSALHSATLSIGNPVVKTAGTQVTLVDQLTLDSFVTAGVAVGNSIDVLKVDVEGYELEVFRGAESLLAKHHPLIICEIEYRHNADYIEVFRLLRMGGYKSFVFQGGRYRLFEDNAIEGLQLPEALQMRLAGKYDSSRNAYVNNFVFQHCESRIRVL